MNELVDELTLVDKTIAEPDIDHVEARQIAQAHEAHLLVDFPRSTIAK